MRQRNNTPWPVTVPQIPAEVQPGETIDWPDPITGLTPVDPPQESTPVEPEPADPTTLPQPSNPSPGTSSPPRATTAARKKPAVVEAPASGAEAGASVKE